MVHKKIRVAFIVGALPFGGIEVLLLDAIKEILKRKDANICIFNLSGQGKLIGNFKKHGIDVISIGHSAKSNNVYRVDTLLSLLKKLKYFNPDIIHTQHFSADFFGRIAGIIFKKPTITHIHNTKKEKHYHRIAFNKVLSHATTAYISVSKSVHADCINTQHNTAHKPVHLLYNAIDHIKMASSALDLSSEFNISGRTIIAVGRLVPQKNFDLLIRAVSKARRHHQDISLLIVGDGGERKKLLTLIESLNMQQYAVLAGYRSDVPKILAASALFAAPSEYEGFCIAHLEAMFHGLPAVISRNVPSVEIAGNAAVTCDTNVDDIAAKIIHCLDPAIYNLMSEEAVKAAKQHDIPNYVDHLMNIYQNYLSKDER